MKKRVLIVDDETDILEAMSLILESEKIETRSISDPGDMENTVSGFCPDLIIMDVYLGKASGIQLCRMIRNNPSTSHIPILLTTAGILDDKLPRYDGLLEKPFEIAELEAVVAKLLS